MKNLIKITVLMLTMACFVNCEDDDATVGDLIAPTNLTITAEVIGVDADNPNGDGSGFVKLTASADNALSYNFQFGDGLEAVVPSGVNTHRYSLVGLNTYTVVVSAVGTGGVSTTGTIEVEVFSSFDDIEAKELLSGGIGSSKTWYLDAASLGHLGVGGNVDIAADAFWFPSFYAAQPFEKCGIPISDCLCTDEFIFSLDASEQLTFELNNNGQTFFNASHQGVIGENAGEDACFDFDTSGVSLVSLAPSSFDWSLVPDPDFNARATTMNFSDDKFMGYYVGSSSYDIISVTNTTLYVRTVDALNPVLYWYHRFTTTPPNEEFNSIYNTLIWSDEFDTNGAPDAANWTYDLGAGGWGNGEVQTYTNTAENVIVEDGFLKITAKADGSGYTSARLKSENLFEFTYGRVEVRAKLPASIGTWPAIWMLGADYDTNTWPACGEIDIMEQTGQDKNRVLATVHHPAVSPGAGDGSDTILTTSTTEFHNYTVEWTPDTITFLVDDTVYHTVANSLDLPFESDFFLILNIAMGGTLGGDIDPAFTEDSMEIDYVRVYQ
ncbi:glycoside hydrolase family 16 protein [Psychroserpens algicola]|uniref:Glycoside hydrolase family 16 protein n=1 Tax=Psychroserpens algicola TaxID=1719034 RepID=A0ABT0H617_9FLAO|nr:glycoside hydrolase family 16 protein [Psychroserpens algicola]MCK8479824.1 glycoside hydrolase family 16 protein [Psychroserpens algicola]